MNSTTSSVHTTTPARPDARAVVVSALIAMAAHLDLHDLPIGFGVNVSERGDAGVTLDSKNPGALAADLIAWADTLTAGTFTISRLQDGDGVLLSVNGRLPEGVRVCAYGTADYAEYARAARAEVDPGHGMSLSLDALRGIADTAEARP